MNRFSDLYDAVMSACVVLVWNTLSASLTLMRYTIIQQYTH